MNRETNADRNENQSTFLKNNFEKPSKNVVTKLEEISKKYPEKLALIDDIQNVTYKELIEQSNQLAHYLKSQGVQQGGIVGVCIPQSVSRIIAFLAILKTGAAYLPIDGELPQTRIQMMIEDANIDLMLTV